MELVGMIKPTSRAALKSQCLMLCQLNVEKAEKMYDFLVKDIPGIPEVEPMHKPFIQNFGEQASGVLGWFRDNEDMISQGVEFIKGILKKKTPVPTNPIPPINQ